MATTVYLEIAAIKANDSDSFPSGGMGTANITTDVEVYTLLFQKYSDMLKYISRKERLEKYERIN